MQFYDVKEKKKVDVDMSKVSKKKFDITTKTGKQMVRYAFVATLPEGRNLTKFCSEDDFRNTDVPEIS